MHGVPLPVAPPTGPASPSSHVPCFADRGWAVSVYFGYMQVSRGGRVHFPRFLMGMLGDAVACHALSAQPSKALSQRLPTNLLPAGREQQPERHTCARDCAATGRIRRWAAAVAAGLLPV